MKVTAYLRTKTAAKNNLTDKSRVFFRVRDTNCDIKAASELSINPNHWSAELQGYKTRVTLVSETKKRQFNRQVREISDLIAESYRKGVTGDWLQQLIDEYHHPHIHDKSGAIVDTTLTEIIKDYVKKRGLVKRSVYKYNSIIYKILRFERYKKEIMRQRSFSLKVDTMTENDLYDFREFCMSEHSFVSRYPSLYEGLDRQHRPSEPLSENGVFDILHCISSLMKWCERNGIPTKKPFSRFELKQPVYGTPWYLTLEERDRIYNLDLSEKPKTLCKHRDIFMFQCLIGCRMGDIPRLTKANIVNGAIEYIPHKTKDENPMTVRVPLNDKAKAILERYSRRKRSLLPHFVDSKYNDSIRELCTLAGITRMVSVIDVKTNEEVKRPVNEIASSHLARRTFIGNLYKKVKDPDLIGSMSGHVEGSRAFARYRAIDDEMKIELVNLIN